ncbi:MAG: hypothetical protein BGO69_19145 [Bacteroidetes bacterium 46-16]|nr:MAG: hypothetical protein BGO69_19145 [Bacteroidetes bacterium 46-16]
MKVDDIKGRLLGKHVRVHNLDFEVFEKDRMLRIIPHAEQVTDIKTLPITHIEFKDKGDKTQVVISSKIRKIDQGGPMILMVFVSFMLIGAVLFLLFGGEQGMQFTYTLLGIALVIFAIFWMRMQAGYFDYVRKIRDYVKKESAA